MKCLSLFVALLLLSCAQFVHGAPAVVNSSGVQAGGAGYTTWSVASGDALIVLDGVFDTEAPISGVSDGQGSYHEDALCASGFYFNIAAFSLFDANSGTHTIAIDPAAGQFVVIEVSGLPSSNSADSGSLTINCSGSSIQTSITSGTLANANDMVFAFTYNNNVGADNVTAPSGWTNLATGTAAGVGAAYLVPGSTSALTATFGDWSSSSGWGAVILGYEPSSSSSCTHTGWIPSTRSFGVPTAGSTVVWNQSGTFATVNCSSNAYWQSGRVFGDN